MNHQVLIKYTFRIAAAVLLTIVIIPEIRIALSGVRSDKPYESWIGTVFRVNPWPGKPSDFPYRYTIQFGEFDPYVSVEDNVARPLGSPVRLERIVGEDGRITLQLKDIAQ